MTTSTETPAAGMTRLPAAGTNWQARGLCREVGPGLFFPGLHESAAHAKRICAACEVRLDCLEYALAADEHGVWGATTYNQRRAILRARQQDHITVTMTRREERNAEIARLTEVGLSPGEIAEQVGCCERTVFRVQSAQQGVAA